jgi:hypothetical protein
MAEARVDGRATARTPLRLLPPRGGLREHDRVHTVRAWARERVPATHSTIPICAPRDRDAALGAAVPAYERARYAYGRVARPAHTPRSRCPVRLFLPRRFLLAFSVLSLARAVNLRFLTTALRSNYTTIYHVYSLSTGRPHSLAANEGLLEMPEGRTISGAASGLCGDYIGATAYSLSDKSTNLVLWNWKTGERKVDAVSV